MKHMRIKPKTLVDVNYVRMIFGVTIPPRTKKYREMNNESYL